MTGGAHRAGLGAGRLHGRRCRPEAAVRRAGQVAAPGHAHPDRPSTHRPSAAGLERAIQDDVVSDVTVFVLGNGWVNGHRV